MRLLWLSLTWRFSPAGVSSPQVIESACTGCVRLCAAAQRLFKRVSCRSFLRAPPEGRRGRFLTHLLPCHARRVAAVSPAGGAGPPPRHASRGVCLHIRDPRGAGTPRPIGRPAPRPGDVTGGGASLRFSRPAGLGVRGGRAGTAPPGGRRSPCPAPAAGTAPGPCTGCDCFSSVICVESATHTPEQQRLLLAYSSVSFVSEFSKVVILQVPALS
ncbi:protein yippee-like 1 isoform X1 [Parus major]|uniref:protein yippee-like 1 isoform X1 n=1 Tax=Parus major TaxID=9157 RepID=UPI001443D957|nr:protein yippee-like 1 isoform X1 [Parus major]